MALVQFMCFQLFMYVLVTHALQRGERQYRTFEIMGTYMCKKGAVL
jgi:hypothetical protein